MRIEVAGTGERGYTGDGGPATLADLHRPLDVAVDGAGNIYFSSQPGFSGEGTDPPVVRRVDTQGIITTVAGGGPPGTIGDGGLASDAHLKGLLWITLDAEGNLYIAEDAGFRVRKVTLNG